ncbi:DUF4376 domain-containing protein [Variovorax paradoxus]|uniref:DUF4376 domain-containing protein n=1 Tax=Variovorax paradoxus TaxID=34073 RepID=UPI0029C6E90E|nr:DUF4376 domain-containing protein [Variovorax paradoxus]WPH18235.1 DUF4376 domain-containing protein [Variovorax paradoxus]
MTDYQEPQGPPRPSTFPFTIIGEHGRVLSTGVGSMLPPELPGTTVLQHIAPSDSYWDGTAFVPMGAGEPHETYDWPSHTWVDRRTLEDLKRSLADMASAYRVAAETSGLTLPNGIAVNTAREDQARITSVLVSARLANVEVIDFKAATGWVTMTLTELEEIARTIALHVQACFTAERAHHQAIAALTNVEAAAAYDLNSLWPPRQR